MCGITAIRGILVTIGALIGGAIASTIVAIGLNTNFFTSLGAPAPMAIAAGLVFGAAANLTALTFMLRAYYRCANPRTDRCAGRLESALAAIAGAIATLLVQGAACLTLAGVAWIPWSIQVAAWTVVAGVIPLIATLATALAFINQLESCLQEPATGSSWGPVSVASELSGVVRWRPPRIEATRSTDLLDVVARRDGDRDGLAGTIEGAPVRAGEFMQVAFVIRSASLAVPLYVNVNGRDGAFRVGGALSNAIVGRPVAGPQPVTLTSSAPRRTDLVFELYELG